ncbi:MAG: nucleotidyltransferase domain-containing protein [Firmicutes bacterium]|nr:nucleotidyltransferase domain-containing protein [Bacillota bacterium]
MLKQQEIDISRHCLIKKVSPYLIIFFGSALPGRMLPESDIDIAFLSDQELGAYDVFMIGQELAGLLCRDVDLVDLKRASTVFQARVIITGKVVYCNDEAKRMLFEMVTLKKYARLNEERMHIMGKLLERGLPHEG